MKTRSILRRFSRPVLSGAALLALTGSVLGQNVYTWQPTATDNKWSTASNWDNGVPASAADTEIVIGDSGFPNQTNDLVNPFLLTRIGIDGTNQTSIVVSGGTLSFMPGSNSPQIYTLGNKGSLKINSNLNFSNAPAMSLQIGQGNSDNFGSAELLLNGSITNAAANTITLNTGFPGSITVIGSKNNTSFAGTWAAAANALTQLGAVNAVWRNTNLTATNPAAITTGTTNAAGNGLSDVGYNQQVGNISGNGQFIFGTTDSAATSLVGYLNSNATLSGSLAGVNINSHFGKVGTGIFTVSGTNNSANLALSVRDGQLVLSGTAGALTNSVSNSGAISVYGGAQLRLNNTTALGTAASEQTQKVVGLTPPGTLTPAFQQGRLSNTAPMRLAGGVLRYDGNATADNTPNINVTEGPNNNDSRFNTEILGSMRPLAGQSIVILNPNGTRTLSFIFSGVTEADLVRGGQVAFIGSNLGATPAGGTSTVTFTATPSLSNGVIPWGLSQLSYTSAPTATTVQTGAPDALATYGANGVAPLTTLVANDFSNGTQNVQVTAPAAPAGALLANSLTFENAGVLTVNGSLQLTSGAIMGRGTGAGIAGTGAITVPVTASTGTLYLNSSVPFTIANPISASGISKGGASTVTLSGPLTLSGTTPIISVNNGTLTLGPGATTPAGTIFQVAKAGTLSGVSNITGTLRGNGSIATPITIAAGGLIGGSSLGGDLTTGAAPGTMLFPSSNLTLSGGSKLRFYISSAIGASTFSAGNAYTQGMLSGTGTATLNVSGGSVGTPIIVQPQSLVLSNNGNGPVYDFDGNTPYTWTIANFTGGIVGFTGSNQFQVDTSLFANPTQGAGFSVIQSGTMLQLTYDPTPEPVLLGLVPVGLYVFARRRKA